MLQVISYDKSWNEFNCGKNNMRELFWYFWNKLKQDKIGLEASALSFTSALAFIPALSVALYFFAVFPAFADIRDSLKDFASTNLMPVFSDALGGYVGMLLEHAAGLTAASTGALFVIALMLIRSIDSALNRILMGGGRKIGSMLAVYWTLLTLGPLSLGALIWIFAKVMTYTLSIRIGNAELPLKAAYFVFPIIIEVIAFTALYVIVPSSAVKLQHACAGAVLVTIAFEISKKIFSVFVLNFSSYEMIYGAFAAVPVLMIWIYISWWLVLLGAEFIAALEQACCGNGNSLPVLLVKAARLLSKRKVNP